MAERLRRVGPLLDRRLPVLIDDFYAEIERHPETRQVITGGAAQVERLKGTLIVWLRELFSKTDDEDYVTRRWRVGLRHVQIGLMFGDNALAAMPMDAVIAGELEILGSHGMAAHEYPSMLGAVASGDFRPVELVGRTIALDDVPAALAAMGTAGGAGSGMTVIEL